jgi:RES domain-containing protein
MATPHALFSQLFATVNNSSAPMRKPWNGDAFRATLPKWMSRPYRLTGIGAALTGGRWSSQNLIPAVYFSTTAATVAVEADAEAIRLGWPPGSLRPQTRVPFHLALQSVVDLTDAAVLRALHLSRRDLVQCDWQTGQLVGREALTQAVGRAAFETYAEGLVAPSARLRGGINVVVFPSHVKPGSLIIAHDEQNIPFVHGL